LITIGVLGPLTLAVGGTAVDVAGRRERAVLAVLAANAGTAVSVGRLADHLWDGEPPRTARKALQMAVSNIRSTVAAARNDTDEADDGSWLVTTESGYRLVLGTDQVDLIQFEQLVAAGREQLRDGEVEAARDSLAAALVLWRGDVPAVLGDGVAAAAEDARLCELRLRTLADRVDADLAAGQHTAVIAELTALCEQHPDRERCHGSSCWRCIATAGRPTLSPSSSGFAPDWSRATASTPAPRPGSWHSGSSPTTRPS
jgi:DNA-binding SARP family transcriptional activator